MIIQTWFWFSDVLKQLLVNVVLFQLLFFLFCPNIFISHVSVSHPLAHTQPKSYFIWQSKNTRRFPSRLGITSVKVHLFFFFFFWRSSLELSVFTCRLWNRLWRRRFSQTSNCGNPNFYSGFSSSVEYPGPRPDVVTRKNQKTPAGPPHDRHREPESSLPPDHRQGEWRLHRPLTQQCVMSRCGCRACIDHEADVTFSETPNHFTFNNVRTGGFSAELTTSLWQPAVIVL